MQQPPEYFNSFYGIIPPEVITILLSIESSLALINYDSHLDLIASVFDNPLYENDTNALVNAVYELYREHVDAVLQMQGISLANPYIEKLLPIAQILNVIVLIGTSNDIPELLAGITFNEDDSPLIYVSTLIADYLHISVSEILTYISDVNPAIMTLISTVMDYEPEISNNNIIAAQRFKNTNINTKNKIVTETIKKLGYFGYNINTILTLIHDEILALIEPTMMASEICLLALGSNVSDELLLVTALNVAEIIIAEPMVLLKTNAVITKLLGSTNE